MTGAPNELRIDTAERDIAPNALKPNKQIINTQHGQVNARGEAVASIRWEKEKAPLPFASLGASFSQFFLPSHDVVLAEGGRVSTPFAVENIVHGSVSKL